LREEDEASNATRREILKKALDRSYRVSTIPGENALYMTDFDVSNTSWGGAAERAFGQGAETISGAKAVRERADAMLWRAGGDTRFMTDDDRKLHDYLRRTERRLRDRYIQEQGVGEEVEEWGSGGAATGGGDQVQSQILNTLQDIAKTNRAMLESERAPRIGMQVPAAQLQKMQREVRAER
jgi:hypothetical protein